MMHRWQSAGVRDVDISEVDVTGAEWYDRPGNATRSPNDAVLSLVPKGLAPATCCPQRPTTRERQPSVIDERSRAEAPAGVDWSTGRR